MTQATSVEFSSLSDRYSSTNGKIPLSGIQGIVRSIIDSRRADIASGLNTGIYISGYQGSPLGGLDSEIMRSKAYLDPLNIVFHPGLNEELAATAVAGTQLIDHLASKGYRGVTGVWYGKSPGVDRASDAIRHGNLIGTHHNGGVLLLAGDDPAAKSSTVPGSSDATLSAMGLPVFFPGNTREMLVLSRHAILASRASGLWSGFKVATKLADSTGVYSIPEPIKAEIPVLEWRNRPYHHIPDAHLLGPKLLEMEETLNGVRLEIIREYIYRNQLNTVSGSTEAKLGIIAVGTAYFDLIQALSELGVDNHPLLRIMKLVVTSPLDKREIQLFAKGLQEILVLEEKSTFVERMVKDALYRTANEPIITGKHNTDESTLVPSFGALETDDLARIVAKRFAVYAHSPSVEARIDFLDRLNNRVLPAIEQRTPFFCSGCPHNTSTAASDDTIVGAGIGCHTLILLNPKGRGTIAGVTQMGGEGAQFIGMAPFVTQKHFTQNMGDGTFHHSGSLAIRAAIAAKLNITYKILYNDAVAMTGGQHVEGQLSVANMIQTLYTEGVSRIVVTTDDPHKYAGIELPRQTSVYDRFELPRVEKELGETTGVTVIIHDQLCAIEKRRRRRTKKLDSPKHLIVINERTCEGCGDCGAKSNCLSVEPVETRFGRKTRINQGSCSFDQSCLKGDCPAFLLVDRDKKSIPKQISLPDITLDLPHWPSSSSSTSIRLIGIGGTGVVTIAAILEVAALLDHKFTRGLDQTGLSQKAGPVISDIHISESESIGASPISAGKADVMIGFDLFGTAAEKNLRVGDPTKTIAVVSSDAVPNGLQVTDVTHAGPDPKRTLDTISTFTLSDKNFYLPAQKLAEVLFSDQLPANVILLGAAWQLGLIPISLESITKAFQLNAVAVKTNLDAFSWGRISVLRPEITNELLNPVAASNKTSPKATEIVSSSELADGKTGEIVTEMVDELIRYQNITYAMKYLNAVVDIAALAKSKLTDPEVIIQSFAKYLYKLMAYKDEYEVARLHLEWLESMPSGTKSAMLLHPPILRALGMKKKIELRKSALISMKALYRLRFLRAGKANIFGYTKLRRWELRAAQEYTVIVKKALSGANDRDSAKLKELIESPDLIRGYEEIKLNNIAKYNETLKRLELQLSIDTADSSVR